MKHLGTWLVAALLLAGGPALAAKPVLGFVDVNRLQTDYTRAREVRGRLDAETQKYQLDLQEGQQKIQALEAEVASADLALQKATGDTEVKAQFEMTRDTKETNLAKTRADYAARLQERRELAESLGKELNDTLLVAAKHAIEKVAKKHGLDGVLDSRASLYGAVDLTNEVLGILNASPSARGKK